MSVLWLKIHGIFLGFFLLFNSVASAVTAYKYVSLSQLSMFLATLSTELRNLSNMFLALLKFKEDPWGFWTA